MRYAALRLGGKWASADIRLPASLEGTVVLVAPIWDGRLAPPAQKALEQINRADTVLVTLSKRSVLRDAMGCKEMFSICEGTAQDTVIQQVLRTVNG